MNYPCCSHFFLGANTPEGFYSLYNQLHNTDSMLYILKGGPGCGKSSFMKRTAKAAESCGHRVKYVHCSGDPDSLDAIIIPTLGISLADGTAPHILEPVYPAVSEMYIDLSHCYDSRSIRSHLRSIVMLNAAYKTKYDSAYRLLAAVGKLGHDLRDSFTDEKLTEKLHRRGCGIISRELPRKKCTQPGVMSSCFISSVTCKGYCSFVRPPLSCRVYRITDSFALAHPLLRQISLAATERGYNITVCRDCLSPESYRHVYIPELSLAFITSSPYDHYDGEYYRHIRLDNMVQQHDDISPRDSLRSMRALMLQAIHRLSQAKELHDKLEAVYNPYVDFDEVYSMADDFILSHITPIEE